MSTPSSNLGTPRNISVNSGSPMAGAKAASTITLLAGVWLFLSPWAYGAYRMSNAWNSWIVGGFMVLFALTRIARPAYSTIFSWFNMVLGIWIFFSPWIYGYAGNSGRFVNSLCVGGVVFAASIISAKLSSVRTTVPLNRP